VTTNITFPSEFCTGHGRLSCAECNHAPKPKAQRRHELMTELAEFMDRHRLDKLEFEDETQRFHFSRHPSAFAPAASEPTTGPIANDDLCGCGHSLSAEHVAHGCLQGCGAERCNEGVTT